MNVTVRGKRKNKEVSGRLYGRTEPMSSTPPNEAHQASPGPHYTQPWQLRTQMLDKLLPAPGSLLPEASVSGNLGLYWRSRTGPGKPARATQARDVDHRWQDPETPVQHNDSSSWCFECKVSSFVIWFTVKVTCKGFKTNKILECQKVMAHQAFSCRM